MLSFKDLSDYYDLSEEEIAVILFCLDKAQTNRDSPSAGSTTPLGLNPHSPGLEVNSTSPHRRRGINKH